MKSTACQPSYDYSSDENLVKLKDCTTDARAHLASFDFSFAKKIQVLVSFRFLTSIIHSGTQRIVSVNYLFGRPLIPYNFLKIIFASNFRDMGNLRPGVFGLIKMSFRVPKLRRSAKIFGKEIRPTVLGNGQKCPSNFEKTQVSLE